MKTSVLINWILPRGTPPAPPDITVDTQPSFDPARLYIGQMLQDAWVGGSYSSLVGVASGGAVSYTVGGVSRAGTYRITFADTVIAGTETLLLDGIPNGQTASTGATAIAPLVITETSPASFDAAILKVGSTVAAAYIGSTQTNPLGVISEAAPVYTDVGDVVILGSTVIQPGDLGFAASAQLLIDGFDTGQFATVSLTPVSNTKPTAGDVAGVSLTVPAGPAVAPAAFVLANWAATDLTTGGAIDIDISTLPADNGYAIDQIAYSTDGGTVKIDTGWLPADVLPNIYSVTGLVDDVALDFTLWAHNAGGWSLISDVKTRTPTTAASGPSPFTVASDVYFKDLVGYPTADGKLTLEIDGEVSSVTGTPYLAEMDNSHMRLLCNQSNSSLYFDVKDSVGTVVRGSTLIGAIVLNQRFRFIASIDLGADTVITSWDNNYVPGVSTPTVVTHTVTPSVSGILASAGRKMVLLARAGGIALPSGTFRQLKVWNDFVPGGGIPATDALLLANGYITGPAATANAHPWKLGAGSAT